MRFHGVVGFGESVEEPPDSGIWEDVITEKPYSGNVIRNQREFSLNETVTGDISVSNSISIVADGFALENFLKIKYVVWEGVKWIVPQVEVLRPRLILSLGGVYNGPTP